MDLDDLRQRRQQQTVLTFTRNYRKNPRRLNASPAGGALVVPAEVANAAAAGGGGGDDDAAAGEAGPQTQRQPRILLEDLLVRLVLCAISYVACTATLGARACFVCAMCLCVCVV